MLPNRPAKWGIDPGIVAYNAMRAGLPRPLGLWVVWERHGDTLYDLSGNGVHGYLKNGASLTVGGVQGDGSNDHVYFYNLLGSPGSPKVCLLKDYPFVLSIVAVPYSGQACNFLAFGDEHNNNNHFGILFLDTGVADFSYRIGGVDRSAVGTRNLNDGQYHVLVARSPHGSLREIYADGVKEGENTVSDAWNWAYNDSMNIGKLERAGDYYYEVKDFVFAAMWNRDMTPSQIARFSSDPYVYVRRPSPIWAVAAPAPSVVMNQLQGSNLGADLFNGTLL